MATYILGILLTYKYLVLVPIAFIEGPLVTLFCGFLWKSGHLYGPLAVCLVIITNLLGDALWYHIGARKGERFVERFGRYVGITEKRIERAKNLFDRRGDRVILVAKLTNGFGFIIAILFTAGLFKMNFKRYMTLNIIGESIWSVSLLMIGYYFGHLYLSFEDIGSKIKLIALSVIVGSMILLYQTRNKENAT